MDDQTQQRLETLLATGIGVILTRLVAERFITDLVPAQRGLKDDLVRALMRAAVTVTSSVLAAVIIRQVAHRGR
jgi:hypothetical protein